jgi:hypothetical protein
MLTLNQQRALHSSREFVFPECLEKLRAAASFDVSIEVDWDSLAEIDYLHMIVPNLLFAVFENSSLTLDHLPNANVDSVAQRVQGILKELESKL